MAEYFQVLRDIARINQEGRGATTSALCRLLGCGTRRMFRILDDLLAIGWVSYSLDDAPRIDIRAQLWATDEGIFVLDRYDGVFE